MGTAEGEPFSKDELAKMLAPGEMGTKQLVRKQREVPKIIICLYRFD